MLRTVSLLLLLTATLLGGCARFGPGRNDHRSAVDGFILALRWQQYPAAASYFSPELRQPFLDQMDASAGLTVTDVRLVQSTPRDDGRQVDARLELEYYRLPSATVKTRRIDQVWSYRRDPVAGPGFVLTTAFPPLP